MKSIYPIYIFGNGPMTKSNNPICSGVTFENSGQLIKKIENIIHSYIYIFGLKMNFINFLYVIQISIKKFPQDHKQ